MSAAKVFAVPEFLETILKHVPFSGDPWMYSNTPPPTIPGTYANKGLKQSEENPEESRAPEWLFGIERVNRDFRNTIRGSHILRRLMFLEPLAATFKGERDPHGRYYLRTPLYWLMERCFVSMVETPNGRFIINANSFYEEVITSYLFRPEASWRQIRFSNFLDSGPISIVFEVDEKAYSRDSPLPFDSLRDFMLQYTELRVFEADAMLGELFEEVRGMVLRSFTEHTDRMALLVCEEALVRPEAPDRPMAR